jgi:RNA polymerase sigma-70 factor, ECF subfamily
MVYYEDTLFLGTIQKQIVNPRQNHKCCPVLPLSPLTCRAQSHKSREERENMTEQLLMKDDLFPDSEQDIQMISACRRDPAAFVQIYDRYVQTVYRYLYSRTGNPVDAEDITAQTFLTAMEKLENYREDGHLAAWLVTIARNKAYDFFRKTSRFVPLDSIPEMGNNPDLLQEVIRADRRADLIRRIGQLPEDDQELLRLRFIAQISFKEMGKIFNRSEAAVKKNTYRILARLQSQMEEEND